MRDERALPWLAPTLETLLHEARGHALILHGGAGSGVLELSLRLAQGWLCEAAEASSRPCDQCGSCHLVRQRAHPDLRLLLPELWQHQLGLSDASEEGGDGESKSKRKPSKEIRVEAIRQAIDWTHTTSGRGRGKVLVMFPADAMNAVSANALLKTLEEPAAGLRLVLCTDDPERLLPTIRSRCQRHRLPPPPREASLDWLSAQGIADAPALLGACGDEPLSVESAVAQGLSAAVWRGLPAQLAAGDGRVLSAMAIPDQVRVLQQLCHDAMAVAVGGAPRFFPADALPAGANLSALLSWSRELTRTARHAEHPWQAALLSDALLRQAQEALRRPGPARRVGTLRA
jgi:DNA polymerase-3 subunit delta'